LGPLSHLSQILSTAELPQRDEAEMEAVTDTGVKVDVIVTEPVTEPVWVTV